ncbi:MAG: NAD-dependent epimerase/dehydratase family protein [Rhodoglobus sp.]
MARVLITGGSGLIGRRVAEAYKADGSDELVGIRRSDVDLLAPGAWLAVFNELLPDVVIHLAWSASALPDYRSHDDNWRWAETTIEAATTAVQRGIRFLATGTSVDIAPARDAYSMSKAATREALATRIASGDVGWLRPFYVFDEERPSPAVLRAALDANSAGRPVRLASPHALHDFVHAKDVGTAIRSIVEGGLMGSLDLGSGARATVADLVEAYGCRWVADGTASQVAASEAAADVAVLRVAGWTPRVTDARLHRVGG